MTRLQGQTKAALTLQQCRVGLDEFGRALGHPALQVVVQLTELLFRSTTRRHLALQGRLARAVSRLLR